MKQIGLFPLLRNLSVFARIAERAAGIGTARITAASWTCLFKVKSSKSTSH